jgi:hypothetical protein
MIVRANIEQPFRLGHMTVAARDLILLANRAKLPVFGRARLYRTGESWLKKELLAEQRRQR